LKLSKNDYQLFYKLMWSLQFFAKEKTDMFPEIDNLEDYTELSMEEKLDVRNYLFDNLNLIDEYIGVNPQNFSTDELDIVKSWKKAIKSDFFIERILKKHSIFIDEKDENKTKVYAVVGLVSSFNEMIPKNHLPLYINTVLLPFKDKIIYDGLFNTYNIFLGTGMTNGLKNIYLSAKQNKTIIENLEKKDINQSNKEILKIEKNFDLELSSLEKIAKKLRGGNGQHPINGATFSLIKSTIRFAKLATKNPNSSDIDNLLKELDKVYKNANNLEDIIYRMEQ